MQAISGNPKLVVIGDVHGCAVELRDLLRVLDPRPQDTVVFTGDVINRGPDSCACLDMLRAYSAQSVVGNHELRLLKYWKTGDASVLKEDDKPTARMLRDSDWQLIDSFPLTLRFPEYNCLVVHGGFVPGTPWDKQGADIVTQVQVLDKSGRPAKRSDAPDGRPWGDTWRGPWFVVYGHTPRFAPMYHDRAIGIDTGCIYGGALTAFILPDRRVVEVPAHQRYDGK